MYYGKIEADSVVDYRLPGETHDAPGAKTTALGLLILVVGLPILGARIFVWAIARNLRGLAQIGAIVGQAATDTARRN